MTPSDRTNLVEAYVASCHWHWNRGGVFERVESTDWASDKLFELAEYEPALAWELVRDIAARDASDQVLERLANGPLATLLRAHGAFVLPLAQSDSMALAAVRELFASIWDDHAFDIQIWNQVLAISGDERAV